MIGRLLAAAAGVMVLSAGASAGTLNDFNLVVFGDHQTGSNVWGRVAVGGKMSGNSMDIATKLTPAANYYDVDTLLVGGNLQSNINLQAGDVRYGGSLTGNINRNGGGATHQQVTADGSIAATVLAMKTEISGISNTLKALAPNSTSGVGNLQNRYTLTAGAAAAGGTAVFNIGASVFSSNQWAEFTLNNAVGAQKIVINVDASGTSGDVFFTAGNIDANTFKNLADRIVWNFYNADSIVVQREMFGSMIGVGAHLSNTTNLNGSIAVGSFNQSGEVHGPNFGFGFTPPPAVPLPTSGLLACAGLGAVMLRRRRA